MLQDSSVIMRQARGRLVIQADILSKKMLLIFSSEIKSFKLEYFFSHSTELYEQLF